MGSTKDNGSMKPSSQPFPEVLPQAHNGPFPGNPLPIVFAEELSLHYSERAAIEGVTLMIPRGHITTLIGPSGSGKSSFLMCLNRLTDLIPHCRVSGRLLINNRDILSTTTDILRLRRQVGMIFQKPNPFPMSIRKNLAFPLKEHGIHDLKEINERVGQSLTQVGLWDEVKDRLDTSALALSGGQQQRLCIARALILSPEMLLMDEPCSALDPLSSGVVEDLISSLRGPYTIVIVTHNLAQARRIADYAGLFWTQNDTGRLIEFGPSRQIFQSPQEELTAAYINGIRG